MLMHPASISVKIGLLKVGDCRPGRSRKGVTIGASSVSMRTSPIGRLRPRVI
jgi:hypothetical protein